MAFQRDGLCLLHKLLLVESECILIIYPMLKSGTVQMRTLKGVHACE